MGVYREKVLPRLIDKVCSDPGLGKWRARCLEGAHGTLVEPGFGSGTNLPYYPPEVERVFAIDPATVGQELAASRLASSKVQVDFIGLDGQRLPLENNTCDGGVLTFSLCTIPEPVVALAELRRVIKPGGLLFFLEHGKAVHKKIYRQQLRIDPVQRRLFDGCHVSRDHPQLIRNAGFEILWRDSDYADGPKPWSFFHIGQAINPPN